MRNFIILYLIVILSGCTPLNKVAFQQTFVGGKNIKFDIGLITRDEGVDFSEELAACLDNAFTKVFNTRHILATGEEKQKLSLNIIVTNMKRSNDISRIALQGWHSVEIDLEVELIENQRVIGRMNVKRKLNLQDYSDYSDWSDAFYGLANEIVSDVRKQII